MSDVYLLSQMLLDLALIGTYGPTNKFSFIIWKFDKNNKP